jgi:hypothetical protein
MPLAFIDTETTSLNPESGRIWEFAGIRRDWELDHEGEPAGYKETTIWFQIDQLLHEADPFALKIGKYYERFGLAGEWEPFQVFGDETVVVDAVKTPAMWPTKGEVVSSFTAAQLIEEFTKDCSIIGNVISFDAERLDRLLKAEGRLPRWHYHIIDIEPMVVGYALAKGIPWALPYQSSELTAFLGVPEPDETLRHTALGDATWVRDQWDALHNGTAGKSE